MAIHLIGSERLSEMEMHLEYLGGFPARKYPGEMIPTGGRPRQDGDPVDYHPFPIAGGLAGDIYSLRQKLADNIALVENARARIPDHWNRIVLEAFERGEACYPPTFECGAGAGNYCTDLVSDGKTLYRTRAGPGSDYRQRLEAIAAWEDA